MIIMMTTIVMMIVMANDNDDHENISNHDNIKYIKRYGLRRVRSICDDSALFGMSFMVLLARRLRAHARSLATCRTNVRKCSPMSLVQDHDFSDFKV